MQTEVLSQIGTSSKSYRQNGKIPSLENGDVLTSAEFERRYEAMPNAKAELIEGVVYMSSPVRIKKHAEPHSKMGLWLGFYQVLTNGTKLADNGTLKVDEGNDPQPDLALWVDEKFGGNAFINQNDYLEGAPELIVEIASSTVSYDLHAKKNLYERIGVKEYVVWRVLDNEIDWFALETGKYEKRSPDENNIIESKTFGGLRLNVKAMCEHDLQKVLADLQEGMASKKHAEFIQKLNASKVS